LQTESSVLNFGFVEDLCERGYQNYLSNFPDEKPIGEISADWLEIGQDESMVASSFSTFCQIRN